MSVILFQIMTHLLIVVQIYTAHITVFICSTAIMELRIESIFQF